MTAIETIIRTSTPTHWAAGTAASALSFGLPKGVRGDEEEH